MNTNTATAALMSETSTEVLREAAVRLITKTDRSDDEARAMGWTIAELLKRDPALLGGML